MPKMLKTLERNEGKAPLLVPHSEEEDARFRQLSLRFLQSRQWRNSDSAFSLTGSSARMKVVAPTLESIYITERSGT